jgi:hypothetical protein
MLDGWVLKVGELLIPMVAAITWESISGIRSNDISASVADGSNG